QCVVHLQQRDKTLAPAFAHPQFCVRRGGPLNERIHREATIGAPELFLEPRVIWVCGAGLGFFTWTRTQALLPFAAGCPIGPMPACGGIEREITIPARTARSHIVASSAANGSSRSYCS